MAGIAPPPGKKPLFGRIIVTIALVGGLVGGLVAVRAGKRTAAVRKARMMAPADVTSGSGGSRSSSEPPAPTGQPSPSGSGGSALPPGRTP